MPEDEKTPHLENAADGDRPEGPVDPMKTTSADFTVTEEIGIRFENFDLLQEHMYCERSLDADSRDRRPGPANPRDALQRVFQQRDPSKNFYLEDIECHCERETIPLKEAIIRFLNANHPNRGALKQLRIKISPE